MKKGSLTIFYSLILMFVLSLMFVMAEAVRVSYLNYRVKYITPEAVESAFSEYNPYIWKKYKILGIDTGYGQGKGSIGALESRIMNFADENSNPEFDGFLTGKVNFGRLETIGAKANKYGMLTDSGGQAAIVQGSIYEKEHLIKFNNGINDDNQSVKKERNKTKIYATPSTVALLVMNGLEVFTTYDRLSKTLATGIMHALVENTSKISKEKYGYYDKITRRSCQKGNDKVDSSLVDKAIYIKFLMDNYESYHVELDHDGLTYEIEYILNGKDNDYDNLAVTCEKLLAIRTGYNMVAIRSIPSCNTQATTAAALAAALVGQPEAEEVFRESIFLAWSTIESVMDVRLLLAGGKVADNKTEVDWTSSLLNILVCSSPTIMSKNNELGKSYEDYLEYMLALESTKNLGMRSLEVIEQATRLQPDYSNICMDSMVYSGDFDVSYNASEMFLSYVTIGDNKQSDFGFSKNYSLSYLDYK